MTTEKKMEEDMKRVMVPCSYNSCHERAYFDFYRKSDVPDIWTCVRHQNKSEVLGMDNKRTEKILVNYEIDGKEKCWHNGKNFTSGFVFGDGYKAFADDFPVGTKLKITAEIEVEK